MSWPNEISVECVKPAGTSCNVAVKPLARLVVPSPCMDAIMKLLAGETTAVLPAVSKSIHGVPLCRASIAGGENVSSRKLRMRKSLGRLLNAGNAAGGAADFLAVFSVRSANGLSV